MERYFDPTFRSEWYANSDGSIDLEICHLLLISSDDVHQL